jgi:hypothetical protein
VTVPRRRGALAEVRCHPRGHLLASIYRGPGGELRIRYDARVMLDPVTLKPIASRADLAALKAAGYIVDVPFLGPTGSAAWFRCRCGARSHPLSAGSDEIHDAAAAASAEGQPKTITAVPSVFARLVGESTPPTG